MNVLICESRTHFVSALSAERLFELSAQHHVVVNEFENTDLVDSGSPQHYCHIVAKEKEHLQIVKVLFPHAHEVTPLKYNWQRDGREGYEISWSAKKVALSFQNRNDSIKFYTGPSGHQH